METGRGGTGGSLGRAPLGPNEVRARPTGKTNKLAAGLYPFRENKL